MLLGDCVAFVVGTQTSIGGTLKRLLALQVDRWVGARPMEVRHNRTDVPTTGNEVLGTRDEEEFTHAYFHPPPSG